MDTFWMAKSIFSLVCIDCRACFDRANLGWPAHFGRVTRGWCWGADENCRACHVWQGDGIRTMWEEVFCMSHNSGLRGRASR